jgi:hypothetical protein
MKTLPLALFLLLTFNANSITITWDGGAGDGLWSSATNWNPDQVPGAGDDVIITGDVTLDLANISVHSLTSQSGYLFGSSNLNISTNYDLNNGLITSNVAISIGQDLNWHSGQFYGGSLVNIGGSLNMLDGSKYISSRGFVAASGTWQGGSLQLDAPGYITINGTFTTNVSFTVGPYSGSGGTFTINGSFDVPDGTIINSNIQTFVNNGTIDLGAGSQLNSEWDIFNTGTINMEPGSLIYSRINMNNAGALNGSGTINIVGNFGGQFVHTGSISPGLSPGILYLNKLPGGGTNTYIELQGSATPGTDYDQIAVTGTGVASGTLNVSLLGGYVPDYGSQFVIMTCGGGCSGTYTSLNLPDISPKTWAPLDMSNPNQIVLRVEAALPIELAEFKGAKADENTNLLTWRTVSESNNRGFEVQHGKDGKDWRTLGFVPGSGATTSPQHYEFRDENPAPGINYYRLRQIDFDGQASYSDILVVRMDGGQANLRFFPNPATAAIEIQGIDLSESNFIHIVDATGKHWLEQPLVGNSIDVSGLPPGVYTVMVMGENTSPITARLVRQ